MLINAEVMTLISATIFLLASCILLDLHDNIYCWENHCNADENLSSDIYISLSIFLINLFYLFLAVLGLRCCARAFSSCGEQGLLFLVVRGFLIAVASLVVEHGP